jgi:hypothetical protein
MEYNIFARTIKTNDVFQNMEMWKHISTQVDF